MKAAAIILTKICAWLDAPRLAREEKKKLQEQEEIARFMALLTPYEREHWHVRIFFS